MVVQIDARSSRELQAVISAVKVLPRDIAKHIRAQTKRLGQAEWQRAMLEQAETRVEHRVLVATARASVSDQNIKLSSASVGRPLAGGLDPKRHYAAVEFGGNPEKYTEYLGRRKMTRGRAQRIFEVRRRTMRQLRPRRRQGYVFYPAANRMIPRIFSLWAQTVVRATAEALEGRNG